MRLVYAHGSCMRPLVAGGSLVAIDAGARASVGFGDVVFYRHRGKNFLHRVWWQWKDRLWLKDDAGTVALHSIRESAVRGLLQDGWPLNRGWIGVSYSLINSFIFSSFRALKRVTLVTLQP